MIKDLSLFFPLFNEEGNVENIVKKAKIVLEGLKIKYEIILVNDGSSDNTEKVINRLASKDTNIVAINHPKNLGYGEALKSGFYNAKYDTLVYTDGDGQFDFSEITKFLEKIEDFDVIVGHRIKRQDPFFRIVFKQGWKLSLFAFFGLTLKDVDCGFKMVKRKVLEKIPHLESQRGAMINAELVIKAKKAGFKIGQVGVNHYPRLSGKPTGASLNVIFKSYLDLLKLWWKLKDQKRLFLSLIFVLFLAAFLRFYKIEQFMIFLGDQGRDVLILKEMVKDFNFPFIGPSTSVGNIYLGPLYYYMMFIPMFLTNLNPASAAVMNAVIGVMSVFLIYYLGKVWFGRVGGLISSFLYAISPVAISYSNFSWNPNPLPFFALLTIFSIYRIEKTGNFLWVILTGASLAAALQMHYLALILIPVVAILWVHEVWYKRFYKRSLKTSFESELSNSVYKKPVKNLILGTILGKVVFLSLMSPLFIFDLKHRFVNFRAVTNLFSESNTVSGNIFTNFVKIPQIFSESLIGRYMTGENFYLTIIVSVLIIAILVRSVYRKINSRIFDWPIIALGIWLIVGLIGISFYQNEIYDHYLLFLSPAPFLLLGSLARFKVKWPIFILVVILAFVNLQKSPILKTPNNQLERTIKIAKFVIDKSEGQQFNFALLAESNYDPAYVFFLDQMGHKPKQVPAEKTSQMFVVCEDKNCDPTHDEKYELAAFGMSKIEWMENFEGLKIYKLIPNPSGKP